MPISQPKKVQFNVDIVYKKAFYLMWMPLGMPYSKIYNKIKVDGYDIDDSFGIIESGKAFGFGWIGVKVISQTKDKKDVIKLNGEFNQIEITGEYSQIKDAYTMAMKAYPESNEYYNIYYNSPSTTPKDELKTAIIYR